MTSRFATLNTFYEETMGWPMEQVQDNTILSVTYQGNNAKWVFVASTDEENDIVTLFARAPEPCPAELFNVMSEFIDLANFGMTHGAWVIDRNDGEIRYRVGMDAGGLTLTDECLRNITLYTNLTMDRYLPGLRAILKEGKSAKAAFKIVFPE